MGESAVQLSKVLAWEAGDSGLSPLQPAAVLLCHLCHFSFTVVLIHTACTVV